MTPAALALLLLSAALPAAEAPLPVPVGLTLNATAPGRLELLWDPVFEDDLLGYSVWLRKPGAKDFTRLNVSVKAGEGLRKTNIINEARLPLKVPEGKQLELTVLAHYERGDSGRSASAYTALAARSAAAGGPEGLTKTPAPGSGEALRQRLLEEPSNTSAARAARFEGRLPRRASVQMAEAGGFRSRLGVELELRRVLYEGHERFGNLRLTRTAIPADKVVDWKTVYTRNILRIPLGLSYGLFKGWEVWGEAAYHFEGAAIDDYEIDGKNFDYVRFVTFDKDLNVVYLADPGSSRFGDSTIGCTIQPVEKLGLKFGVQLNIPTGLSRSKAYLDWRYGKAGEAGTGEGVYRPAFQADLGRRGEAPGLSLRLRYRPAATERYDTDFLGLALSNVFVHGEEAELGLGYTFPWTVMEHEGSLVLNLTGRSYGASSWSVNGQPGLQGAHATTIAWFTNHTGLKDYRDDQFGVGVEVLQGLPGGIDVGGQVSYTSVVHGDSLRLQGNFYY